MSKAKKSQFGLTLLELLVALVISSILVGVAVPSFKNIINSNRMLSKADLLKGALALARSESAKRNLQVSLCKSSNLSSCDNSTDWDQGWIVFVDADADMVRDVGEPILQKFSALSTGYTISASASFADSLAFLPTGALAAGGSVTDGFRICGPDQNTANGRSIFVNAAGRPRIAEGVTAC